MRSRDAVVQLEGDAGLEARLGAFERQAAFEPEELLEDQAELRGRAEGVQQAEILVGRREMDVADGGPAIGEFEALAEMMRGACLRAERS